MPRIRQFLRELLELAYPPHCVHCGTSLRHHSSLYLCGPCRDDLSYLERPACPRCGEEVGPYVTLDKGCANCRTLRLRFDGAAAPTRYEGLVRELILRLKLGKNRVLAHPLGQLLLAHAQGNGFHEQVDVVMPVPLHWRRRLRRGFNQAELLATDLASRLRLPLLTRNLRRLKSTSTQTRFSRTRRFENVRNAFAVRDSAPLEGQRVLLVDDVMTTGATASECARMLKRAGCDKVYVLTVAR